MSTLHAPGNFWDGAEIVHTYSRAEAIADGVLIDVTKTAREAGFRCPVAVTAGLWADIEQAPPLQDAAGRLWDVLWMGRLAAKRGGSQTVYNLILPVGRKRNYQVKMHAGPGDAGELVITLMRPDED